MFYFLSMRTGALAYRPADGPGYGPDLEPDLESGFGPAPDPAPQADPALAALGDPAAETPPAAAPALPVRPQLKLRYDINSLDNRDRWFVEKMIAIVEHVMQPYHRAEVRGMERVPRGAALYVGNHSGGAMTIDSFLFGAAVYRAHGFDGLPFVLAHDFAMNAPGLHHVFSALGCVRASRDNARRLFAEGRKVLVYPGGSEESMRPFRDRNKILFGGKRGYVRTALEHGVPIVPVVGQGSHGTLIILEDVKWMAHLLGMDRAWRLRSWSIAFSLPWGLTFFPPPLYLPLPAKIRMEVLEPIRFERSGPEAAADDEYVAECAAVVEGRMQEALTRLARR